MPADPRWAENPAMQLEGDGGGGGNVVGFFSEFYFTEGQFGGEAKAVVRRSHPELVPNGKVEVPWSWKYAGRQEEANWSIVDGGARIAHTEPDKTVNVRTDLGKLAKSVTEHLPYIEDFDPRNAASWLALEKLGDIEFGWEEEAKRMPDPADPTGKRWIVDPDKADKPKRTMVIVGFSGAGASNGQADHVDLSQLDIPDELLPKLVEAAKEAVDGPTCQQKLIGFTMGHSVLLSALTSNPEGLRQALLATEPF